MITSKQGSIIVTYLAILGSFTLNPFPSTNAIDKSRLILMKDALSWMTFRKDGILMNQQNREDFFLATIISKYTNSKFYRVFVIQFQLGVLPKLTLNEGASCDPSYTWKYKDPWNSSVTWHYQKQFVAESYRNRNNANLKYCDYRQGLICNQFTRKCECPEGSKMQEISPNSPVKRCLLEEHEICALIDIDHGNKDPKHESLVREVPKLMFNLEKPPSCMEGTQCRFTDSSSRTYPRCHDRNLGDWIPRKSGFTVSWPTSVGEDCTIGLYADPGQCDKLYHDGSFGPPPGLICYNFGRPVNYSPGSSNRTGQCAHEYGSFANVRTYYMSHGRYVLKPDFTFMGYVHQRSVPLRGYYLAEYYKKYQKEYLPDGAQTDEGQRCSSKKTERMHELWKYFVGLENTPPPGQDYVPEATNDQLYKHLNDVLSLARFVSNAKFCRAHPKLKEWNDWKYSPPLKCAGDGNPMDTRGNDGTCEDDPENVVTKPAFDRFYKYIDHSEEVFRAEREEDKLTSELEQILEENKEKESCMNEGNKCQEGFWCYDDLSDKQGIYEDASCKIKDPSQIEPICHDMSDDTNKYGNCEGKLLDERISKALEEIGNFPNKLGRGEECQAKFEKEIREAIGKNRPVRRINKYSMLGMLENEKNGTGKGMCDITRLLYCSPINEKCECFDDTEPREVYLDGDGMEYQSDYCYKTIGDCQASSFEHFYQAVTMSEKEALSEHYGKPDTDCKNTNLCLFVTEDDGLCTSEHTGISGGGENPSEPPGNGWGEAGTTKATGTVNYWNIVGLIVMIIVFV